MNHQIIYQLYYAFVHRNFSVLRFNFRGVGRSQGSFDHGQGELSDAASALDWAQTINPEARSCWIAGFSFGAWIGMQLLMRRPEIEGFISIAPPANLYDFSFLAPCPSSGLIVHGDKDAVVPHKDVNGLVDKLKTQKGIVIEQKVIPGANHFFDGKVEPLMQAIGALSRQAAQDRAQAERGVGRRLRWPEGSAMAGRMWLTAGIAVLVLVAAGYGALHYMTGVPGRSHQRALCRRSPPRKRALAAALEAAYRDDRRARAQHRPSTMSSRRSRATSRRRLHRSAMRSGRQEYSAHGKPVRNIDAVIEPLGRPMPSPTSSWSAPTTTARPARRAPTTTAAAPPR